MNLFRLVCRCHTCDGFAQPHSFWLTDQKGLLVVSICVSCEAKTNCLFALDDLFKTCPEPDLKALGPALEINPETPTKPIKLTTADKRWLHELGAAS